MICFSKPSPRASLSAAVLILCTTSVAAVAAPGSISARRPETHRIRAISPTLELQSFHPESTYEVSSIDVVVSCSRVILIYSQTFGEGIDLPLSKRATPEKTADAAAAFIKERLGLTGDDVSSRSSFDGEGAKHAWFDQKIVGTILILCLFSRCLNY